LISTELPEDYLFTANAHAKHLAPPTSTVGVGFPAHHERQPLQRMDILFVL
jgi:hypothetical protein